MHAKVERTPRISPPTGQLEAVELLLLSRVNKRCHQGPMRLSCSMRKVACHTVLLRISARTPSAGTPRTIPKEYTSRGRVHQWSGPGPLNTRPASKH